MIGPVLNMELLVGTRRGKLAVLARIYATWLMIQLFVLLAHVLTDPLLPARSQFLRRSLSDYLETLVRQHFVLMVLVTPAFVAGAIADEKARGTLEHLLTAGLTSWHIVLGKLLGRVSQLGYLGLMALPPFALVAGMAELPGAILSSALVVSLAPLFGLGALSILASVWSTQTREAVLRVYWWLVLGATLVALTQYWLPATVASAGPVPAPWDWRDWVHESLRCLSPIYVLDAAWGRKPSDALGMRLCLHALAWGSVGIGATLVAVWRLRPAFEKQLEKRGRRPGSWAPGERRPVDDAPLVWKEREAEGIALVPALRRMPRWTGVLVTALSVLGLSLFYLDKPNNADAVIQQGLAIVVVSGLIVGVRSSGTICLERERGTWESLLLTPYEDRTLVREKFRGILQATRWYLWLGYAVPAGIAYVRLGWHAIFTVICGLVAAWIAMYHMAAVGVWCSARSSNSWRCLLATLIFGCGYGFMLLFGWTLMFACFVGGIAEFFGPMGFSTWDIALLIIAAYLGGLGLLVRLTSQPLLDAAADAVSYDRTANLVEYLPLEQVLREQKEKSDRAWT